MLNHVLLGRFRGHSVCKWYARVFSWVPGLRVPYRRVPTVPIGYPATGQIDASMH